MSFLTQIVSTFKQSASSDGASPFELSRKQPVVVDLIIEPKTKWQKVLYELNYAHEKEIENYAALPVGFNLYKWLLEE